MTDAVMDALVTALTADGINAKREYSVLPAESDTASVCVGVESCRLLPAGCGDYLGTVERNGTVRERYGYRCELSVRMDIFAPTAADCTELFDELGIALAAPPTGIKYRALVLGETEFDEVTELFHARCSFLCIAMLERSTDTTGGFSDFTLRGVTAR